MTITVQNYTCKYCIRYAIPGGKDCKHAQTTGEEYAVITRKLPCGTTPSHSIDNKKMWNLFNSVLVQTFGS